ncbi:TPA: restriction endonuclease subunit S [Vibrio parahaemolyticus]|nr:restriction endonuclease subunit S [Vibrio parahaemolyticus]HCH1468839.1 restriction endonuclease subunit S [Vibrio parahaemolyticus]
MGKYQAYPEYKESGIEWITEIPSHWHISNIGHESSVKARLGWKGLKADEYVDEGYVFLATPNIKGKDIDFTDVNRITKDRYDESPEIMLQTGDVLVTKDGSTTGTTNLVRILPEPATVNSSIAVLRSKGAVESNYLFYFFVSDYTQNVITRMRGGMGVPHLFQADLRKFSMLVPPLLEQTQIANFLEHETAKIDTLIEKQQQLITLLKEKRQAVISHAVTKGLNPDAPMKDSGVEWLGEVPEHWVQVPLKHLCRFSGGGTPSKDNLSYWTNGTTPWVSPKDMKTFWIEKTQDYVTDIAVKESSTSLVESGALLMVVRSGILQRTIPIAINTVPVTLNQDMKALRFNDRMLATFAADYILGNVEKLLLEWSKEGATVESIEHEYLANSILPVPPIDEQRQIVDALTKQKQRFNELEGKAARGIKLLQERRTALISAAVTGKIDVRNWQAPVNQEAQQQEAG